MFLPGLSISEGMIELVEKVIAAGDVHDVHGVYSHAGKAYVKVMRQAEEGREKGMLERFKESIKRIETHA